MKSFTRCLVAGLAGAFSLFLTDTSLAATLTVTVGGQGGYGGGLLKFSPATISINSGDTVKWTWAANNHSTTSGTPGNPSDIWDSGVLSIGKTFTHTFDTAGSFPYYCSVHGSCCSMKGTIIVAAASPTPTPTPRPPSQAQLLNISTRMRVQTGENVLIGGFILTGAAPKEVLLRVLGPSLAQLGVTGVLSDPELELHAADGSLIMSNDNWKDTQEAEIEATGIPPSNDLESAIIMTLAPDNYTAIVSGKNGTSGIGLVEAYDLDQSADSQLANISTRGLVETGNDVMIGGFILGNGTGTTNVLIRALGPSLTDQGVSGALADPTLELHDADGTLLETNDNWKDSQQTEIEATGIAPTNDLEAAIITTLPTTALTAIVAGKGGLTGVALVEVYRLP